MFRITARIGAYLIALLLAAVWTVNGLASLTLPFFDIGRAHVGDTIIAVAGLFQLSPAGTMVFAQLLSGLKVLVGLYLFVTVVVALGECLLWRASDDAMLDVGLMVSAIASLTGVVPSVTMGGEPLQGLIGELMLCVIASALAIYGRGFVIADNERPRPVRPAPVVIRTE
jgi:hypothetical protein